MPSILIVEDSPTQAEGIRFILEAEGFMVSHVASAEAALALLDESKLPDLILSDVMMPDTSGFDFCSVVKGTPSWRHIPFILLTALHHPMDMIKALESGADNFIVKPYDAAYLINRVRSLLANRPTRAGGITSAVDLTFLGQTFSINYDRQQILSMLMSSFEDLIVKNQDLSRAQALLASAKAQLEDHLAYTQTRLDAIFHAIPDAIVLYDLSRTILTCNPAFDHLFGYLPAEMTGCTTSLLYADEADSEMGQDNLESARPRGIVYRNKGGQHFTGETIRAPVHGQDGAPMGFVEIIRDVTARRQLEEEFRQSQKMEAVGRLAGGVAHDFNNLLTVILGSVELLQGQLERANLGPGWRVEVDSIRQAADRASSVTRQLLTLSRRQTTEVARIDLNEVVSSMENLLLRIIGEDIDLKTTLSKEPAWVLADKTQIEQIILNLAVNAKDAMPEGGHLHLSTMVSHVTAGDTLHFELVDGTYCMLAVSDTGPGIDKSIRDRIFDPFFTTKKSGTGLGLSTVYTSVQAAHGHLWLYSEPDHGSTFKIYLPYRHLGVPRVAKAAPREPDLGPSSGQETVVVVEDDDSVRRLMQFTLQRAGYRILEASHGEQAIRLCQQYPDPIDLLLTDMVMPGMSGIDLAVRITALRPDIKIVYTSGYTEAAMTQRGLLAKQVAFLEKPFTPDALVQKIREVLAQAATLY